MGGGSLDTKKDQAELGSIARKRKSARKIAPRNLKPIGQKDTEERILDSVGLVLRHYGHAGFTMRLVAETSKISLGNLTYHFPSKSDLLRAFVTHLVTGYWTQFDEILTSSDAPVAQEWERLVRWLLADTVTEDVMRLFREIWAMQLHDPSICRAVDDFYDELMEKVVQRLMQLNPNAEIKELRELVQTLTVISEGTCVLYGTRRKRAVSYDRFFELAVQLLGSVALKGRIAYGVTPKQNRPAKGATKRRSQS
jgi:AcrR family transcriptional regulator